MAQGYLEIPATQGAISDLLITLSTRRVAGGFAVRIPLLGRHRQQGGGAPGRRFFADCDEGGGDSTPNSTDHIHNYYKNVRRFPSERTVAIHFSPQVL